MASSLRGALAFVLLIGGAFAAVAQTASGAAVAETIRVVDLPGVWAEARRRSPRLPAAAAAVERAEAAARLARATWLPSLRDSRRLQP